MDYTEPAMWPQLLELEKRLDGFDYYQILNLPYNATTEQIRASYYQFARALHPDKFYVVPDETVKAAVHKIYKRITEAYSILKDGARRPRYTADIQGPDRIAKLRYSETSEADRKREQRAATEVAKTPQGKKMYNEALLAQKRGDFKKAIQNLQSALLFEPGNEHLSNLKAQLEAQKK